MTRHSLLLVSIGLLGLLSLPLKAQQTHVDQIYVDTRATFHEEIRAGVYGTHFQGDHLNLHILGQLTDQLSFRVRQRLNKKIYDENPFNATDFLWLKWQATPHFSLTAGKQAILIGGYEIDSAPIDVYYYGAFSNNLTQYYAFGVSATWTIAPGQNLTLEFCPSPISDVTQNAYSYNLYWGGHIGSFWQTTWSYNLVEDPSHRFMNYIALGNKFLLGPLVVDIDYINRHSFQQQHWFFTDGTLIGKAILSLGKWNLCTKVGYEWNDAANVIPEDGTSFDRTLLAGDKYFYGGAGVEFFPMGDDKLRLHLAWFRDNHNDLDNFDLGITWRFTIYKRNIQEQE